MEKIKRELHKHKKIGIDSMVFIYNFEDNRNYSDLTSFIFDSIAKKSITATTSFLTYLEIIVMPIKEGNKELVGRYREIVMEFDGLFVKNLDFPISDLAGELIANHKIKALDAIQIATAIRFGASTFITNDKYLKKISNKMGIEILILDDLLD